MAPEDLAGRLTLVVREVVRAQRHGVWVGSFQTTALGEEAAEDAFELGGPASGDIAEEERPPISPDAS